MVYLNQPMVVIQIMETYGLLLTLGATATHWIHCHTNPKAPTHPKHCI